MFDSLVQERSSLVVQERVLSILYFHTNNGDDAPLFLSPKNDWVSKNFDHTETVSYFVKDEKLLTKYNEICRKIKIILQRKKFTSGPMINI